MLLKLKSCFIFSKLFQADFDEMSAEARLCEEKASKAMVDAAKLADELRAEQEAALGLERNRKLQECQVKDLQGKLDEADMNALKGGKKAMNKLETRIRELQSELEAENRGKPRHRIRLADHPLQRQAGQR